MLAHAGHGVTGQAPDDDDLLAIEVALGFAVIDSAPLSRSIGEMRLIAEHRAKLEGRQAEQCFQELVEENENSRIASWTKTGTSDNVEPYIWPVSRNARIAMDYGAITRTTVGGSANVVAPTEMTMPMGITADSERVSSLYEVLASASTGDEVMRLREALRWLLQAWRNTPSLRPEQRIALLRTAFDVVLTDRGEKIGKEKLARRLSDRFPGLIGSDSVGAGEMLWQPGLERDIENVEGANGNHGPFDDLERWFIGFSEARNAIVHDGSRELLADHQEDSVFAGEYWWAATRVIRDLVLAELHARGYHALWANGYGRAARKLLERLGE